MSRRRASYYDQRHDYAVDDDYHYRDNVDHHDYDDDRSRRYYGHEQRWDSQAAYSHGYGKKCCPHVVDPVAFTALLAAIPLVTVFLNMQILDNIGRKRKRRRRRKRETVARGQLSEFYLTTAESWHQGIVLIFNLRK